MMLSSGRLCRRGLCYGKSAEVSCIYPYDSIIRSGTFGCSAFRTRRQLTARLFCAKRSLNLRESCVSSPSARWRGTPIYEHLQEGTSWPCHMPLSASRSDVPKDQRKSLERQYILLISTCQEHWWASACAAPMPTPVSSPLTHPHRVACQASTPS